MPAPAPLNCLENQPLLREPRPLSYGFLFVFGHSDAWLGTSQGAGEPERS